MGRAPLILVTGATGTMGGTVARELRSAGVSFVALVRDRARAEQLLGADVELREGDYDRADTLAPAFDGVDTVFIVAPLVPELAELEGKAIDAAARAGVRHAVLLSSFGAALASDGAADLPRQYSLHRDAEEHLERSGIGYTHLRPGPLMQNTLNSAPLIAAGGFFRGAFGDGAMGYVDLKDVGAVAARVLTGTGHEGKAYELTGPEALSCADIAVRLSAALGREIRYDDVPPDAIRKGMASRGMPEWFANATVEVMEHARTGDAARVTDAVSELTGRPPRSYAEFASDSAPAFSPA